MKNFKASKQGKYIQIDYLGYKPANSMINNRTHGHMWFLNGTDARKFMTKVLELEVEFGNELIKLGLSHNPNKIIRFYLNVIDSISSGLDIRSDMSNQEIAKSFVSGFNNSYNEKLRYCQSIIESAKKVPISMYTTTYDNFNEENDMYEFGLKDTLDTYLKPDPLVKMGGLLDEMLEVVKKINK